MSGPATDPYRVLGVARDATPEQIRAAFRRKVRDRHPDTSTVPGGAEVIEVLAAYRTLSDPGSRARHDRENQPSSSRVGGRPVPVSEGSRQSEVVCASCRGAGLVTTRSVCGSCRGAGTVTMLEVDHVRHGRCPLCRGLGERRGAVLCATCQGRGATL